MLIYETNLAANIEVYSESCQISKFKYFSYIVDSFQVLTIFEKSSILDFWQVSEYATGRLWKKLHSTNRQ